MEATISAKSLDHLIFYLHSTVKKQNNQKLHRVQMKAKVFFCVAAQIQSISLYLYNVSLIWFLMMSSQCSSLFLNVYLLQPSKWDRAHIICFSVFYDCTHKTN